MIFSSLIELNGPWRLVNATAFLCSVFTVSLPNTELGNKIGLKDNKYVSDKYKTLVTPAGFAFAIWGPIFGLEGMFVGWQLFTSQTDQVAQILNTAAPWFIGANLLQADWAIGFGWEMMLKSSVLLCGIAFCLSNVHNTVNSAALPLTVLTKLPFTVHFAWTAIASILNLNITLKANNVRQSIREWFSVCSLVAAAGFGTWYLPHAALAPIEHCSVVPMGVVAWALHGIVREPRNAKHLDVSDEGLRRFETVALVTAGYAAVCFGVSLAGELLSLLKQ